MVQLVLKICPKFQVSFLTSHFLPAKNVLDKTFQIKDMSHATLGTDQRFAVNNSGVFCLTSIFDLRI